MCQCKLLCGGNLFHSTRIHMSVDVLDFFFSGFPFLSYPFKTVLGAQSCLPNTYRDFDGQFHIISYLKTFFQLLTFYRRNSRLFRDCAPPSLLSSQMGFTLLFPTKSLLVLCHRDDLYMPCAVTFETSLMFIPQPRAPFPLSFPFSIPIPVHLESSSVPPMQNELFLPGASVDIHCTAGQPWFCSVIFFSQSFVRWSPQNYKLFESKDSAAFITYLGNSI